MNRYHFEILLEKCLDQLAGGKSLETILQDHPEQADKLKPLLESASIFQTFPKSNPKPEAVRHGKNRLLRELNELDQKGFFLKNGTKSNILRYPERWFTNIGHLLFGQENTDMKLLPRLGIYLLVTIVVAGFFSVSASASSLPGDPLYGLKLNLEEVQKALAFS